MKLLILTVLVFLFACNQQQKHPLINKWQILQIRDDKSQESSIADFSYNYDPAVDTTKVYLYFFSDSLYSITNLFDYESDTNSYNIKGDTLFTNMNPKDYLIFKKGEKDSAILFNLEEQIIISILK
ncbi:MAG: hypothetical protein M3413_12035 [Bacteroidota bacterium]|jgi:hypothetical protein|nr:hypothetical protein [Flavisolibacter sp.]MDQ3552248.1 hypothetical protein [Bacteroidota bacterium]